MTNLRRHPLVLGSVAAVVALIAAAGAAIAVGALTDGDDGPERSVDATIHITPEDQEEQALVEGDPSGEPVPTTSFPLLAGGLGSLADYAGKPVVLNFFGSWCIPCQKEVPELQRVHEDLGDQVTILGLAVNDSERDAKAFIERYGATYETGRDPSGKLASELGVVNFPSTFFISAEGKVVGARPGALDEKVLRLLIEEHLLPA